MRRNFPSYLCPSSCVIVCAKVIPLSSLTLHDLSARHMPPTFAIPSVAQPEFEQMFCLVTRMATSWCCGSSSFFGFNVRCHLSFRKRRNTTEKVKRFQCCINRRTFRIFLPAETVQRGRCDLGHIQILVSVFFFQQNDLNNNNVHGVADGRVLVQRRHHVENSQKISFDVAVLMKLHHRRISNNQRFHVSRRYHRSCDAFLVAMSLVAFLFSVIPYFAATLNDNL